MFKKAHLPAKTAASRRAGLEARNILYKDGLHINPQTRPHNLKKSCQNYSLPIALPSSQIPVPQGNQITINMQKLNIVPKESKDIL